jgi:hypothetical protein
MMSNVRMRWATIGAICRHDAAQRQLDAFLPPDGVVQNRCRRPCVFSSVRGHL